MYGARASMSMMRSFRQDPSVTHQKLKKGTVRRIISYARPYRGALAAFMVTTSLDALITVVSPLLLRDIIDKGILARNDAIVLGLAGALAAVALFDGTCSGSRSRSSPGPRPARWSAGSTAT